MAPSTRSQVKLALAHSTPVNKQPSPPADMASSSALVHGGPDPNTTFADDSDLSPVPTEYGQPEMSPAPPAAPALSSGPLPTVHAGSGSMQPNEPAAEEDAHAQVAEITANGSPETDSVCLTVHIGNSATVFPVATPTHTDAKLGQRYVGIVDSFQQLDKYSPIRNVTSARVRLSRGRAGLSDLSLARIRNGTITEQYSDPFLRVPVTFDEDLDSFHGTLTLSEPAFAPSTPPPRLSSVPPVPQPVAMLPQHSATATSSGLLLDGDQAHSDLVPPPGATPVLSPAATSSPRLASPPLFADDHDHLGWDAQPIPPADAVVVPLVPPAIVTAIAPPAIVPPVVPPVVPAVAPPPVSDATILANIRTTWAIPPNPGDKATKVATCLKRTTPAIEKWKLMSQQWPRNAGGRFVVPEHDETYEYPRACWGFAVGMEELSAIFDRGIAQFRDEMRWFHLEADKYPALQDWIDRREASSYMWTFGSMPRGKFALAWARKDDPALWVEKTYWRTQAEVEADARKAAENPSARTSRKRPLARASPSRRSQPRTRVAEQRKGHARRRGADDEDEEVWVISGDDSQGDDSD